MDVALLMLGLAAFQPAPEETRPLELSRPTEAAEPEPVEPTPVEAEPVEPEPVEPEPAEPAPAEPEPAPEPLPVQAEPAEYESWLDDAGPEVTKGSSHVRDGGFVVFALGVSGCGVLCSHVAAGASGRVEAGYRWGLVSLGVAGSLGGASYRLPESDDEALYPTAESRGSLRAFGIGPFLQINPAETGRFDPFFAVGVEYHRLTDAVKVDVGGQTVDVKGWSHAPAIRLGAGLPIFVSDRAALGLRYDKSIPISGAECIEVDDQPLEGESRCRAWSRNLDGLNEVDRRFVRRVRERPWAVALELRVGF